MDLRALLDLRLDFLVFLPPVVLLLSVVDQDEFLMRSSDQTEVGLENNNATFLEDAAQNADLYIANQNVSMQI